MSGFYVFTFSVRAWREIKRAREEFIINYDSDCNNSKLIKGFSYFGRFFNSSPIVTRDTSSKMTDSLF